MAPNKRKRVAKQDRRDEQLLEACQQRADPVLIQNLVKSGASAWVQDETGWTALHFAAARQDVALCQWLLQHGALWQLVDNTGFTAADIAYSLNDSDLYNLLINEGVRQEVLKRVLDEEEEHALTAATDNATYLQTKLLFQGQDEQEVCVDENGNAVMMGWETDIMERTARCLCADHPSAEEGLSVVNIGHGLGIIDSFLQEYKPKRHVIVEAHPDVLQRMRDKGWYDKPGVEIFEGRWQDWVQSEPGLFDVLYWDTFSEHYKDLYEFFDQTLNIMTEDARFSFFHGLGADNRTFYDVYTSVAEYHLKDCGLQVEWQDVPVANAEVVWKGIAYRYWGKAMEGTPYRLPLIRQM